LFAAEMENVYDSMGPKAENSGEPTHVPSNAAGRVNTPPATAAGRKSAPNLKIIGVAGE
jgi:hypothetical protein